MTCHGFPSFYQTELGKNWNLGSGVLDCTAVTGVSLQKHVYLAFFTILTLKNWANWLARSYWLSTKSVIRELLDRLRSRSALSLHYRGPPPSENSSVIHKVIWRVTKHILDVLPIPCVLLLYTSCWIKGRFYNKCYSKLQLLCIAVVGFRLWNKGSNEWETSVPIKSLLRLHTNTKFLLLRTSGWLVYLTPAMFYLYWLWQWFRKDSSSQRSIRGTMIFLKCVGTEAFLLCATVARLKSMFEYGSTFKLCGWREFLPKPLADP